MIHPPILATLVSLLLLFGGGKGQEILNYRCGNAIHLPVDGSNVTAFINSTAKETLSYIEAANLNSCNEQLDPSGLFTGQGPIQDFNTPSLWCTFNGTGKDMFASVCSTDDYIGEFFLTVFVEDDETIKYSSFYPPCNFDDVVRVPNCAAISSRAHPTPCASSNFSTVEGRLHYALLSGDIYRYKDLNELSITLRECQDGTSPLAPNNHCEHATALAPDAGDFTAQLGRKQITPDFTVQGDADNHCYGQQFFRPVRISGAFYTVEATKNGVLRVSACDEKDALISVSRVKNSYRKCFDPQIFPNGCVGNLVEQHSKPGVCNSTFAVEWEASRGETYKVWVRSSDNLWPDEEDVRFHIGSSAPVWSMMVSLLFTVGTLGFSWC